jgi:hypothetical protein
MERRDLFPILVAAATPTALAQHQHHKPAKIFATEYQLRAFTKEQVTLLEQLADIILPDDTRSPGAAAAKVGNYFDLVAHYQPSLKDSLLKGLEALGAKSEMSRDQLTALLTQASQNETKPTNDAERFFELIKFHTLEGYRLSHIGQTQWIGYRPHEYDTPYVAK